MAISRSDSRQPKSRGNSIEKAENTRPRKNMSDNPIESIKDISRKTPALPSTEDSTFSLSSHKTNEPKHEKRSKNTNANLGLYQPIKTIDQKSIAQVLHSHRENETKLFPVDNDTSENAHSEKSTRLHRANTRSMNGLSSDFSLTTKDLVQRADTISGDREVIKEKPALKPPSREYQNQGEKINRCTFLRPPEEAFFSPANKLEAGRSLHKHSSRPDSTLPKASANPKDREKEGARHISKILFDKKTTVRYFKSKKFAKPMNPEGKIMEYQGPTGHGVRYRETVQKKDDRDVYVKTLVGFTEPSKNPSNKK